MVLCRSIANTLARSCPRRRFNLPVTTVRHDLYRSLNVLCGAVKLSPEPVAKTNSPIGQPDHAIRPRLGDDVIRIQRVEKDDWSNLLHVLWEDGYRGKFPYVWLRDNAPEDHTYMISDTIRSRIMLLADLDPEIKPDHIVSSDSGVSVTWSDKNNATYSSNWLRSRNLSDPLVVQKRTEVHLKSNKQTWGQVEMENNLVYYDFERCLTDDQYFLEALQFLFTYGIGMFENVPANNNQLTRLSEHIGYHYRTHYGDFFEVRVEPKPGNLTFTTKGLGLHTDHPYNEYMPSVQLLHCICSAGVGGESEFVDGFRAAEQLRRDFPHYFKLLSTIPFEYVDHGKERLDHHLVASRPAINLNNDGEVDHIVWNNQMRSWFYNYPVDHLQELYRAMKMYNNILYRPENMILIKLQTGQMVWFDNLRVMHGRREFQITEDTNRHLQGGFFNWDALKSKIRIIQQQVNPSNTQVSI